MECNRHLVIKHVAWRHTDLSRVAICMASAADLSFILVCLKWANKVHFFSADMNCRECWKPHLFLLHLHCVPRCLLDCCLFSAVFMSICPSVCVSHSFSGVLERNASSKSWANSEPDVNNWGGQEAREWLLQYSYVILTWLPATRPCTQYLWSLTDDWGCNAVSSPIPFLPTIPLFFPLYIFSSPVHMPPPFSPPSPSLCCLSSCPLLFLSATSSHPLLICCHLSEDYGMPMGQIQL